MGQTDLGVDPETGWPNPHLASWNVWFKVDDQGYQTTYLARRSDSERGNTTYVALEDEILLRLPSGVRQNTLEEGNAWDPFRPLIDHYCNKLSERLDQNEEGVTRELEIIEDSDADQIIMILTTLHPAVPEVSGFEGNTFVGVELTCYSNATSGAIESAEEFLVTENGEQVLSWREYDQSAEWVNGLPDDIAFLYDELISK